MPALIVTVRYGTCYYWRYPRELLMCHSCCTVYELLYVVFCCVVVTLQCYKIPNAIVQIVQGAFGYGDGHTGIRAVQWRCTCAMMAAMQNGVAKGIFSNEAGLGSAPIAAAAAKTKDTVRQGLVSMTGTFIDTIVICAMTGLAIVIAGSWANPDLKGCCDNDSRIQKRSSVPIGCHHLFL